MFEKAGVVIWGSLFPDPVWEWKYLGLTKYSSRSPLLF